ncbi:hypothetical protein F4860DRAFT_31951 [Xylaria cubensis]|nr:hypothetical protein F4860DRAFT_31951 [Xylaria cubensis]
MGFLVRLFVPFLPFVSLARAVRSQSHHIQWVNCHEHVPSTLAVNDTALVKLPDTLHCGQLSVPMDYGLPFGPDNSITLGLAMHRPRNPKGAIFVNPGGSDAVAVLAWEIALNLTSAFNDLQDYDLMMMDVRGTYSSNPLNVSLPVFDNMPVSYPRNQSEFDMFQQASSAMFQSWIDNSSPPGIVQFVGTKEVVQDYEQIRKALGYDSVSFIGISDGTFRAQKYAATFPSRIDRLVLDANVPHGRALHDKAKDSIKALNRAAQRADAYCQQSESCPFKKSGKGGVVNALRSFLSAVSANNSDAATVAGLQSAIGSQLSGQIDFPGFIESLHNAMAGNLSSLLESPPLTVESVVALPLECGDIPYNRLTYTDFHTSYEQAMAHDATGIGMTVTWQLQLYCSGWPFHADADTTQNIMTPTVLIAADFDPDAPIEWTLFNLQQLDLNQLSFVVRHGDGHTSFFIPDQPFAAIGAEFLTGKFPAPTNTSLYTIFSGSSVCYNFPSPYKVPFDL